MDDLRLYINSLRHDFSKQQLSENDVLKDPVLQFEKWFKEAVSAKVNEPNAMAVATVSKTGQPSSRIVLLRNFSEKGFVFYTNYESQKGTEIAGNNKAALLFFWPELERQVRIEGILEKQVAAESDVYFETRPRTSKLGAWTSPQSRVIPDRVYLDKLYLEMDAKFPGETVPRPEQWGGYVLVPQRIEFWQGRPSRLHDRINFTLDGTSWAISRLAP